MSEQRVQVNFRAEKSILDLLDELRRVQKPVAKMSDIIRDAILEKAQRDLQATKRSQRP
jgi:hypothetical protein